MQKFFYLFAVALLMLIPDGCVIHMAPENPNISGTWNYKYEEDGQKDKQGIMRLVQNEHDFHGNAVGPVGDSKLDGYLCGNTITIYGRNGKFTFTCLGQVEDEKMSGAYTDNAGHYGLWTAERQSEDDPHMRSLDFKVTGNADKKTAKPAETKKSKK